MNPRPTLAAIAVAVSGALVSFAVCAQSPNRADVKAETRAAQSAGELAPAGQQPLPLGVATQPGGDQAKTTPSDRSRASVKAKTKAAQSAGGLAPAGEQPLPVGVATRPDGNQAKTTPSNRSRASVKAETKAAQGSGELVPAGQAPLPMNKEQPK